MIHRLRRRHRRTWAVLAVLLPLLYLVALAARRPAPVMEALPHALGSSSGDAAATGSTAPGAVP